MDKKYIIVGVIIILIGIGGFIWYKKSKKNNPITTSDIKEEDKIQKRRLNVTPNMVQAVLNKQEEMKNTQYVPKRYQTQSNSLLESRKIKF